MPSPLNVRPAKAIGLLTGATLYLSQLIKWMVCGVSVPDNWTQFLTALFVMETCCGFRQKMTLV